MTSYSSKKPSKKDGKSSAFSLREDERDLWLGTWKAVAAGVPGDINVLPRSLLMLPNITENIPSCNTVIDVLVTIVKKLSKTSDTSSSDIAALEAVVDTIKNRLDKNREICPESDFPTLIERVEELETAFLYSVTTLFNVEASSPALLQVANGGKCRSKYKGMPCKESASWKCPRGGQHDLICTRCLEKEQK